MPSLLSPMAWGPRGSWLVQWRAWFRANKLLQDHARRLPPPGGGGCGAGRIPAEPRAAGGGEAAALCAGTLTSPPRPRLRGQPGTAAALRLDALRTLRVEGGTGPGTPGPDPDPPPRQPKPGLGPPRGSKWVTPLDTRESELVRPGFHLSLLQHPTPETTAPQHS
ncbi:wiskott-Aldrich syndrome protein homolog [Mus caroli]|uniref:Wiskott-Aldrich syndrome protein homolog n=1 Tax=Mus caroli TaxID=10089 RepID=A0A6P5NX10_MUSCR|nr:wiskott-Aldrich syndrome protein homolog [Mus caroli]